MVCPRVYLPWAEGCAEVPLPLFLLDLPFTLDYAVCFIGVIRAHHCSP